MNPDQSHQKLNVLNRLVEVSLVINSTVALNPLLTYIMEAAAEITGAEGASILLVDRFTHDLRFAATISPDAEDFKGVVVPIKGSIAGRIVEEDRPLIIDDVSQTPDHFQGVDQQSGMQTKSLLGVPMRIKEKLIGVLEIINKVDGSFTDDDSRYISILASQAAIAIENAQLIAALRKAYEDLNKLDKLKSDFIAIASHELRTPLGIILGYASFLKEEAEGQMSDHAEAVFNSAMHLRSVIESMTNLRFLEIDEDMLNRQETKVGDVVSMACADVGSLLEAREEELVIDLPDEPLMLDADPFLMAMAITNVLNNAVHFTPPDGQIAISAFRRGEEAWVTVTDTGIGLEENQLEAIFQQFYQVEDPMVRSHNGLGLGLAIARAIVDRHGGRIWAESEGPGLGSTFTVAMPLAG